MGTSDLDTILTGNTDPHARHRSGELTTDDGVEVKWTAAVLALRGLGLPPEGFEFHRYLGDAFSQMRGKPELPRLTLHLSRTEGAQPGFFGRMFGQRRPATLRLQLRVDNPSISIVARAECPNPEIIAGVDLVSDGHDGDGDGVSLEWDQLVSLMYALKPFLKAPSSKPDAAQPAKPRESAPPVPAETLDALLEAAAGTPGYDNWSTLRSLCEPLTVAQMHEHVIPHIDGALDEWPDTTLDLGWSLADDIFREKKEKAAFVLVRHIEVTGIFADYDTCFEYLAKLRHPHRLRSIDLSGTDRADGWRLGSTRLAAMTRMQHLRDIEALDLSRADLGPSAVDLLRRLPCAPVLRSLGLAGNPELPVRAIFADPSPFKQLERLDLGGSTLDDAGFASMVECSALAGLEALVIADTPQLSGRGLAALATAPCIATLKQLTLGGGPDLGLGLERLADAAGACGLTMLSISKVERVPLSQLLEGGFVRGIQTLHLGECGLGPEGAEAIASAASLATLEQLSLGNNQLGDRGAAALARSPHLGKLETLGLEGNAMTGVGLRTLLSSASLPKLLCLDLVNNDVSGATFASPVERQGAALEQLYLANNRLDRRALEALAGCSNLALEALDLGYAGIEGDAIAPIAGANIFAEGATLCLQGNPLGAKGVAALFSQPAPIGADYLLNECSLDDEAAKVLADSKHFHAVDFVLLGDNPAISHRGYARLLAQGVLSELSRSSIEHRLADHEKARTVLGAALELRRPCPRCDRPVHINAVVSSVTCQSCGEQIMLSWADHWRDLFGSVFEGISELEHGEASRISHMFGPCTGIELTFARFDPYCYDCKTDFEIDALEQHLGTGEYPCPTCAKQWLVRELPAPVRSLLPTVRFLVAEETSQIAKASGTAPAPVGHKPVIFNCPSCAGALKIDGSQRMVECMFCNSSVYLPDGLWHHLHPVSTVRRWFAWFERTAPDDDDDDDDDDDS